MMRYVALVIVGSLLVGCSGGDAGSTVPGNPGGSSSQTGSAIFAIHIPSSANSASSGIARTPHYVSAATKGMTIAIAGPSTLIETVGLTPSSPGCASTPSGTTCTIATTLNACPSSANCYTGTVATYDNVSCAATCTIPGGAHELSSAQSIAFAIALDVANTVNLALSAVPAAIHVTPSTLFTIAGASASFDLAGLGPHPFLINAVDGAGDTIVGAGSPTFTVAQSGPLVVTIAQPTVAAPNAFLLTPPLALTIGNASLTVTASFAGQPTDGCAQPGAVCSANLTVDMKPMLAVANSAGGSGAGSVALFELGNTTAFATLTTGINGPTSLAADTLGNLYIGQGAGKNMLAFNPQSSTATNTIAYPGAVTAETVDASNNLYVASLGTTPEVVEYLGGSATSTLTYQGNNGTIGITDPVSLATDAGNRLYVLNGAALPFASTVAQYASGSGNGATPLAASTAGFGGATQLAVESGGTPQDFVADTAGVAVWRFPYNNHVSNGNISTASGAPSPVSVALDGLGNVYAGNSPGNTVGEWSTSAAWPMAATATYSTGINDPVALLFDSTGNATTSGDMLVANEGNSTIEFFPAGSTTPAAALTLSTGIDAPVAMVVVP
jgi:hypothetical protein